jgi:superkiller protein 3
MVARLEDIRVRQSEVTGEDYDVLGADPAYAAAFREYGLDVLALGPEEAAGRVAASALREQLVTALDHWGSVTEHVEARRAEHLQALARLADADGWRRQLRDPLVRKDRAALERLASRPEALDQPPATLMLLGLALRRAGALPEAVGLLRQAQGRYPGDFWVNHDLGLSCVLMKSGPTDEAVAAFRAALAIRPRNPMLHVNLGLALANHGKLAEAEAVYRKAIELKPDFAMAHNNLGIALRKQGKLAEAEAAYRKALALKPDYPLAYTNLGFALYEQNRLAEAEAACRKAVGLKPDFAEAHTNLGAVLEQEGRLPEAVAAHRKAIQLKPDLAEAHTNLGRALGRQGKGPEALAACRKAVQLKPDYAEAHTNLGLTLARQGKLPEAVAAYRKALALKPDHSQAHNGLGSALARQNKLPEALAAFRRAIGLKPGDPDFHYNLGGALLLLGELPEAEAAYRKAIELKPDYSQAYNNLGNVLARRDKLPEALAAYRRAIRLKPGDPAYHYNLSGALLLRGELPQAEAASRRAIELKRDYALAYNSLGVALRRQGKFAEAVTALKQGLGLLPPHDPRRPPHQERIRACERLAELDGRLPSVLKGEAKPAGAAERVEFAQLCQGPKRLYVTSARLYAEAFAEQPKLAEDLRGGHRYGAACAAALAAAGRGKDAGPLDDVGKALLRQQALDWLRADLAAWGKVVEKGSPQELALARRALRHWQKDPDLTSLRDRDALAKLAQAGREACRRLWADVDDLLRHAGAAEGPTGK